MAVPSNSFERFNYGLRPCKQIERKVMIEVLLKMAGGRYDISKYTYIGFGSPYYIDYVMFHKLLFMEEMICLEWSDVPKRMKFNKPFKFIRLRMCPFMDYIPEMRKTKRYFIWLDYDRPLDQEMIADLRCLTRVAAGTLFFITIEARPRIPTDLLDTHKMSQEEIGELTLAMYGDWFGRYLARNITKNDLTINGVPKLFYEVARSSIDQLLVPRNLAFHQMFNILYADGAPMLTIGGMIGTEDDRERLEASVMTHRHVRTGANFLEIVVPYLTTREKTWLDRRLTQDISAQDVAFEIDEKLLRNYCSFYKEYPSYFEVAP